MHNTETKFYSLTQWITPGQSHSIWTTIRDTQDVELIHTHDYAELTCIYSGSALHRCAGRQELLPSGSLLLVLPRHQHSLTPRSPNTTIRNLTFTPTLIESLANRFFTGSTSFWAEPDTPRIIKLSQPQLDIFKEMQKELSKEPLELFYLEKFMLSALALIGIVPPPQTANRIPDWLAVAIDELQRQENLVKGLPWFFRKCKRTPNHVARYCRKYYGKTPGQILQRCRLEHAAGLLVSTTEPIDLIAYHSGFNDLSYFYRRFKKAYHYSPAKFRYINRRDL